MTAPHALSFRSKFVPLLLACLATVGLGAAGQGAARPNVIIVMSDDQGYGDFSCHGNPLLKTPNLDRLHDQSIRLTDFHVAPMCTPTRGQLLTGVDALRNKASSVTAGRSLLRPGIPLMSEMFVAAGYRTALFGKWHLGDSYPNQPQYRGFQQCVNLMGWGITSIADPWNNDCFDGRFRDAGVLKKYPGYCTDVWFDQGIEWLRERKQKSEPFLLYLPTNAPHGPCWVAERYKQPYLKKGPANFFGMIANLDENIGRLDAALAELGLADDTILIYLHDNGGTAGVKFFNAGMRAGKTTYYDGGHRAACFIRWPAGKLRPIGDLSTTTEVQDLLPTLLELCGVAKPAEAKFDGTSLADLLRGKTEQLADRMLVVQYGQRPEKWDAAVLWNKWRLVHGSELYDIATDPGQKNEVAGDHSDVVAQMRAHYERWWAGVLPKLDDFVPVVLGNEHENPVRMTAADWANIYCDNMRDVRTGVERNGPWHVKIDRPGTYRFALRRWPVEADAAIAAATPEFRGVDGGLPAGVALPIAQARLKLADFDESKPVAAGDKLVAFETKLAASPHLEMQTWFSDSGGREICGAYFVDVERLGD